MEQINLGHEGHCIQDCCCLMAQIPGYLPLPLGNATCKFGGLLTASFINMNYFVYDYCLDIFSAASTIIMHSIHYHSPNCSPPCHSCSLSCCCIEALHLLASFIISSWSRGATMTAFYHMAIAMFHVWGNLFILLIYCSFKWVWAYALPQQQSALRPSPKIEMQWQEEEEEHADSIWKKLRLQELKKGFAKSTNMDLMKLLKNIDWEHSRLGIPWGIPTGPMESDMFGLSNTKHLHRNAQSCILTSSHALRHWCGKFTTSGYLEAWLSSLAFATRLVSDLSQVRQKYNCMVQF